ncbi:hypothetical protein UlMin_035948 [Ulmus minor]
MDPHQLNYKVQLHDQEWVINVSRILEEGFDEKDGVCVSIFTVPKSLMSSKQEAYVPQVVAIGPYHRRKPEIFEMERCKLTSANRVQKSFKRQSKLHHLVQTLEQNDITIRACYHSFLDYDKATLAWMFAIDASFLLEFLQTYSAKKETSLVRISSKMNHLIDYTRRKTSHHAILRDIIMLENQIPLFLLKQVHSLCYDQEDNPDQILSFMLLGFFRELSPFVHVIINDSYLQEECLQKAHLLDLLYSTIVPEEPLMDLQVNVEKEEANEEEKGDKNWFLRGLIAILNMLLYINTIPIKLMEKIFNSKILMFILMLPYNCFLHFCNSNQKDAVTQVVSSAKNLAEEMGSINPDKDKSPLVEEIAIPSVSELSKIGVKFCRTKGGLGTISFKRCSGKFYLPIIHLDDNSEVVLRNLVAYEASIAPEAMVFTRYTELMNGIIDTEEDARILRECGIVVNRLKSDEEVANLWNGMTKSVRITKVPNLDKVIEEVNGYYLGSWKVKMKRTMKKYLFGSWPFLAFIAANLLLLMSAVDAGCSVYNCSKWFKS